MYRLKFAFFLLPLFHTPALGQHTDTLTLHHAFELAAAGNKEIASARTARLIAREGVNEELEQRLPEVDLHAAYSRITNITEFRNGLGNTVVTQTIPDIADLTGRASFPLYEGSKIKYDIANAQRRNEIATLEVQKATNDIDIRVAATFLGIFKLTEVQQLITEHIKEEEDRLKEVKALRAHGTVTENEVLRANLQLADMQLALLTSRRSIAIAQHNLKTLLQLPETDSLVTDTTGLPALNTEAGYETYLQAAMEKEEMRIAVKQETIKETDRKRIQGSRYPSINAFAAYGFNYPNYLFFPPNPYWYTLGRIGIESSLSLTDLYKSKTRLNIAARQIDAQQLHTAILADKIRDAVYDHYMQYKEAEDKLPVAVQAEQLATENYRIVKLKYMNQLALSTEMVDADNALLQARYNKIAVRMDACLKYYELLYAAGIINPTQP